MRNEGETALFMSGWRAGVLKGANLAFVYGGFIMIGRSSLSIGDRADHSDLKIGFPISVEHSSSTFVIRRHRDCLPSGVFIVRCSSVNNNQFFPRQPVKVFRGT